MLLRAPPVLDRHCRPHLLIAFAPMVSLLGHVQPARRCRPSLLETLSLLPRRRVPV